MVGYEVPGLQFIEALLLASAVILAVQMRLSPFEQPWLMAKIIALLVYIGVASILNRSIRQTHGRNA